MESFVNIVNTSQLLTILTNISILDACLGSEYTSETPLQISLLPPASIQNLV